MSERIDPAVSALVIAIKRAIDRFEAYTADDVRDRYQGAASEALAILGAALTEWESA